jgi:phosphoribosylcarboxyaminoimidazole (NCAIR) mutase
MSISRLERENLEAHVDLCAERYKQLDYRLGTIELKVENIHKDINKANSSMVKVIITSAGTIVASLMGLIATLIIKF